MRMERIWSESRPLSSAIFSPGNGFFFLSWGNERDAPAHVREDSDGGGGAEGGRTFFPFFPFFFC